MARAPAVPSAVHPFHVTGRSLNREWFRLPLESVWSIMEDYLFLVRFEFDVRIHSFVLMPNHFHLLISSPRANLSQAMQYFMGQTAREISRASGRINQTFGCRHHKSMVTSYHYFMTAYKYVYRNPIRARLCSAAEAYRFSTLAGLTGSVPLRIPVEEDLLLFDPMFRQETVDWINRVPRSEGDDEAIRKALRRRVFEFKREKNSKKMPEVVYRLY